MTELNTILLIVAFILLTYNAWQIFNKIIFPKMVYKGMKEVERNPKWVTKQLQYYGFNDIDIVLCESKWGMLPRFKAGKDNRIELWIDKDTSINDIEDMGRLALAGKIKTRCGIWFTEKPLYWLSILCYMLDGGDIKMESISWEERDNINKKPLD